MVIAKIRSKEIRRPQIHREMVSKVELSTLLMRTLVGTLCRFRVSSSRSLRVYSQLLQLSFNTGDSIQVRLFLFLGRLTTTLGAALVRAISAFSLRIFEQHATFVACPPNVNSNRM